MKDKFSQCFESQTVRRYLRVAAFAVFGIIIGGGLVLLTYSTVQEEVPKQTPATVVDAYVLPEADPVHLRIPKIDLDTTFEKALGINQDRTVQVPDSFDQVGWYKYGPTPGELGPAVVLGHVDSYQGPAVFWSLGQLEEGDEIYIDRVDGTVATFTVEYLERHEQADFPTSKVYGNLDYAGLRLITCSGVYDHGSQRYSHNLIVFARLVEPKGEHADDLETESEKAGE